ncbi:hypothetical protein BV898_08792 [Hypsibius exemplaris]|uniref:MARVEL domain-containing protein n=1 Tax=Hypsibius exemplaris TaxID=2072580 RepID=A0A1W0WPE0_HYPEX|nr:hypothetical protein BV898_08792 [Hypsibius exemplaris]
MSTGIVHVCSLRTVMLATAAVQMIAGILGSILIIFWFQIKDVSSNYHRHPAFYNFAVLSVILFLSGQLLVCALIKLDLYLLRIWLSTQMMMLAYEAALLVLTILTWGRRFSEEPENTGPDQYEQLSYLFRLRVVFLGCLVVVTVACMTMVNQYQHQLGRRNNAIMERQHRHQISQARPPT